MYKPHGIYTKPPEEGMETNCCLYSPTVLNIFYGDNTNIFFTMELQLFSQECQSI